MNPFYYLAYANGKWTRFNNKVISKLDYVPKIDFTEEYNLKNSSDNPQDLVNIVESEDSSNAKCLKWYGVILAQLSKPVMANIPLKALEMVLFPGAPLSLISSFFNPIRGLQYGWKALSALVGQGDYLFQNFKETFNERIFLGKAGDKEYWLTKEITRETNQRILTSDAGQKMLLGAVGSITGTAGIISPILGLAKYIGKDRKKIEKA